MVQTNKANSPKDYLLQSVVIQGPNLKDGTSIDITQTVSDIDIYEHLDKPYITGTAVLVDAEGIYSKMGFVGMETFTLTLKLPEETYPSITKKFYIDRVVRNVRTNDYNTTLVLHLIEDIAFLSKFINVNRSYEGKGYFIIEKIVKEYLNKDLSKPFGSSREGQTIDEADAQDPMRVIIPNMNPLDAADWLKDRLTTTDASPYYLFSTFTNKKMHLLSLRRMLTQPILNPGNPFNYSQADTSDKTTKSINEQSFTIESYSEKSTDDISELNDKSFVNTSYVFYDVTTATRVYAGYRIDGYDTENQIKKRWSAYDTIGQRVEKGLAFGPNVSLQDMYPVNAKLPPKAVEQAVQLHERRESNLVTNLFSSGVFTGFKAYNEMSDEASQLLKVDAKALRNWIVNVPVDITLPGRIFIKGDYHTTVGNKYRVNFLIVDPITGVPSKDLRKSGDYLVYAARHTFSSDSYIVRLTVVKIRDERQDVPGFAYVAPPNNVPLLPPVPLPQLSPPGAGGGGGAPAAPSGGLGGAPTPSNVPSGSTGPGVPTPSTRRTSPTR